MTVHYQIKTMTNVKINDIHKLGGYWQRNGKLWWLALALLSAALICLFELGYKQGQKRLHNQALQQAEYELALQVQILESRLEKYRLLPVLMGRHGDQIRWQQYLSSPDAPKTWLQQLKYLSGSVDVLLLTPDGKVTASASSSQSSSYDETALSILAQAPTEGKLGRHFISSDEDALFYGFSSMIKVDNQNQAILAFILDLAPVAESWALSSVMIVAYNEDNRITLASDQQWHGELWENHSPDNLAINMATTKIILNNLHWTVAALKPIDYRILIRQLIFASLLTITAIVLIFALLIRRREFHIKTEIREKLYAAHLEKQINDRTVELQTANIHLTREIQDRIITEEQLKTTQQELIHSAKLATIGQMSTTLSHEYNQPLAAMRTYAENAERFLEMNRTDSAIDNLKRIINQTDRLGNLSKILLSFARKPDTDFTKVNLNNCVEEAFILVSPRTKATPIKLNHLIPENLWVLGNAIQLSQVVINLVSNAIDAINNNEHPKVEEQVVIEAKQIKNEIYLTVRDSGPGIPHDLHKKVFEPFMTTKKKNKGLGLGLSVVKDIIKDHHGTLTLDSSPLGGAQFNITLTAWANNNSENHND